MKRDMFATKERKKNLVIALSMIAVLLITGIMALFTDHKEATNVFTVGSIDIELTEPNWVEANATEIAPNQVIAKDPMITNVGKNDAYTFIKVDIPKQDGNPLFELLDKNGNPGVNDGWVLVETGETADTITYVYGYAVDDAMTRVTPDAPTNVTENLFSSVKVADVEEFKTDSCDIIVIGYGIQADDIPTAPADVWPLIKDTYFPKYEMITSPASIGCGRDALFASDASADIFKEVRIDGTAIASTNYTKSGTSTTEITLKGSYTGTLSKEKHTIEIVSNDGFAKAEFEVGMAQYDMEYESLEYFIDKEVPLLDVKSDTFEFDIAKEYREELTVNEVLLDNQPLSASLYDYSAYLYDTYAEIQLSREAVQDLEEGTHTIKVVGSDWYAEYTFDTIDCSIFTYNGHTYQVITDYTKGFYPGRYFHTDEYFNPRYDSTNGNSLKKSDVGLLKAWFEQQYSRDCARFTLSYNENGVGSNFNFWTFDEDVTPGQGEWLTTISFDYDYENNKIVENSFGFSSFSAEDYISVKHFRYKQIS